MPLYRYLPEITIGWRWFANLSAVIVITAVLSAFFIFKIGPTKNVDVWIPRGFTLLTPTVHQDGQLSYILSTESTQSCPGVVQYTFLADGGFATNSAVVTIQRPLIRPGITVKDAKFTQALPPSITPGHWRVVLAVVSQCPTFTDTDVLAEFHIDVESLDKNNPQH
jgi:hypothetical protein